MPGIWHRVPVIVLMLAGTAALMLVPACHALVLREHAIARAFVYSALLVGGLSVFLALATAGWVRRRAGLLPVLAAIYVIVPAAMALPLAEALDLRAQDAWFEMVAAFTTTGASLIDTPRRLADPLHLWRGLAGWTGGLFVLVSAVAFLAPLRLGGFELLRPDPDGRIIALPPPEVERQRLRAALTATLPWYGGATLAVWVVLAAGGMAGFPALMLAMASLSTSGILPRESLGAIGPGAEAVLFFAMALSLSRALAAPPRHAAAASWRRLARDPELRLAALTVATVGLIVVARHWAGAFEGAEGQDLPGLGAAAWGTVFTSLSFLTTTGLVSHDWIVANAWAGLTPPGLVLMGLALMGGGVATTAGGVKLLRLHAMARMGRLEVERLLHPRMVDPGSDYDRFLARDGALAAWLFAMVFAIVAVALVGVLLLVLPRLEDALIYVVAALTTTGPLVQVAGDSALQWSALPDAARLVLAGAMILGRLEILVILALALSRLGRS